MQAETGRDSCLSLGVEDKDMHLEDLPLNFPRNCSTRSVYSTEGFRVSMIPLEPTPEEQAAAKQVAEEDAPKDQPSPYLQQAKRDARDLKFNRLQRDAKLRAAWKLRQQSQMFQESQSLSHSRSSTPDNRASSGSPGPNIEFTRSIKFPNAQ